MSTTKVHLERLDDHFNFKAINSTGNSILMDGSEGIGGQGNGVRPMETLLMGLAGCSGIDVVLILKKMKQEIQDIKISVEGDREKIEDATKYSEIRMHFDIWGDIKESKVEKAVKLSVEKYCSVAKILETSAEIKATWEVH